VCTVTTTKRPVRFRTLQKQIGGGARALAVATLRVPKSRDSAPSLVLGQGRTFAVQETATRGATEKTRVIEQVTCWPYENESGHRIACIGCPAQRQEASGHRYYIQFSYHVGQKRGVDVA